MQPRGLWQSLLAKPVAGLQRMAAEKLAGRHPSPALELKLNDRQPAPPSAGHEEPVLLDVGLTRCGTAPRQCAGLEGHQPMRDQLLVVQHRPSTRPGLKSTPPVVDCHRRLCEIHASIVARENQSMRRERIILLSRNN